jgi:sterol desaturase/sphingolipid hydroxylase (fatty acid hydroxylase superfamily)
METFFGEHIMFFAYWGAVILLCTIELVAPEFPDDADRSRRWLTNFGLGLLNGLIASAVPAATVALAWWAQKSNFGILNVITTPWPLGLILMVLVRSLAQYAFHVLSHKIPLLWRLHRVHHSDVHLDVSTALRNHPLEMIANLFFMAAMIALVGLSPVVVAAFEAVDLFANILTHANLRTPNAVERRLRLLFVTPALHRLHHSPLRIETDSNYGNFFSIWDRAFGTYRGETIQSGPVPRYGLDNARNESAGDLQASGWHLACYRRNGDLFRRPVQHHLENTSLD